MTKHRIHKFTLTVHALHGQRQIVNIRVDRAGKHTVLTFCPVRKNLNSIPSSVIGLLRSISHIQNRLHPTGRAGKHLDGHQRNAVIQSTITSRQMVVLQISKLPDGVTAIPSSVIGLLRSISHMLQNYRRVGIQSGATKGVRNKDLDVV